MSTYGRNREAQRGSRVAKTEAVEHLRAVVAALQRADYLIGHSDLVADAQALLARLEASEHEALEESSRARRDDG